MNFALVILALLLVGAAGFGIIMIASSNSNNYVDSFGNTTNAATNNTHGIITNSTAPITSTGRGIALLLALSLVVVGAVFVIGALKKNNGYCGRN